MLPTVKSKPKITQIAIGAILSLCLVFGGLAGPVLALSDAQQLVLESWNIVNEAYLKPEKFDQIQWKRLRKKALEKPIESSEATYEAITEMLIPLGDPYTRLLRPSDYEAMKASNLGSEINGVGLQLGARNEDGAIVVISPLEGSPAADEDIQSGSVLTKVDGESPKKLGLEATASKLRGESGSKVLIELTTPEGLDQEITLERRSVDLRPVRTRRIRNESHTLGYLRITQFSEGVPEQVQEALMELIDKDIEGLVLDLRNNSGGLVSSGLAVADAFLSDNPIVETQNREGISDPIRSSTDTFYDGPMVTLVNEGTASASEILAGALKDNDRSQLLGEKTFGKGLIQTLTNLSDGSGLAVTVASYLTPSGRNIQSLGIEPNKYLDTPEPLNPGSTDDRWLQDAELFMEANLDRELIQKESGNELNNELASKVEETFQEQASSEVL